MILHQHSITNYSRNKYAQGNETGAQSVRFQPRVQATGGPFTLTTKTADKEAIPSSPAMASFRFSFILIHHPVRLVDPIFILKLPIADCKIHRDDTFFV